MGLVDQEIAYTCGCVRTESYHDAGMGPASDIKTKWGYCCTHAPTAHWIRVEETKLKNARDSLRREIERGGRK